MKKVLVTGANGYIGKHVVKVLLNEGHQVIAVDNRYDGMDNRVQICKTPIFGGDIDIYEKVGKPDVCIHLAWRDGFVHNSSNHMLELSKHYEFIENMVKGGLKHISIMGSMHEVGYWEGEIDENTPCNPLSLYGIAKNTLRSSLEIMLKDTDVVFQWLRAYYITGDDLRGCSIFSKIAEKELEGAETFPLNSGKNKYDFISIDELAKQIVISSTQTDISGIINCCSGNPISLGEKVEEYIQENGFKIKPHYGVFPDRPYDSPGVWGSNKKIKEIMELYKMKIEHNQALGAIEND